MKPSVRMHIPAENVDIMDIFSKGFRLGQKLLRIFGRQVRTCVTHILGYFLIGNMIINLWMIGFNHGFPQLFEVPNNKKNGFNNIPNLWLVPPPISSLPHLPPSGELQIVRVGAVLTPSAKALQNSGQLLGTWGCSWGFCYLLLMIPLVITSISWDIIPAYNCGCH